MNSTKRTDTRKMTLTAILIALVIILQVTASILLRFGLFSVSLVLIPIVIGASQCGIFAGGLLGFCFGAVVLISGDAAPFMAINAMGAVVTVLLKGILCGVAAGIVYKMLEKVNTYVAVFAAALVCPLVNTGIFLLGCQLFFLEGISQWQGVGNVWEYIILFLVGGNFLFELGVNIILSPTIVRLINIRKK